MVLTKKLDALEEFRIQREQLMAKFEEQVNPKHLNLKSSDHRRDPKVLVIVDRWSFMFMLQRPELGLQNCGRCRQVVVIRRWS